MVLVDNSTLNATSPNVPVNSTGSILPGVFKVVSSIEELVTGGKNETASAVYDWSIWVSNKTNKWGGDAKADK